MLSFFFRKPFFQIVCFGWRKIFNFLAVSPPLINPSRMECKVQKQQCMNHGDLHSPPHFVIPFEIFPAAAAASSNSKLLEVYTIVKVYTEEAKKLLPFYSPKATRAWSDNHTRERWRMCIMWRSVVERAKRARHCVLKSYFNLATTIEENFLST